MSQNNRTPRELETRDQETRIETWAPPELLPTPNPQAGYVFRWVRTATMGQEDATNWNSRRRDGFEPVLAKDHPEIAIVCDQGSRFKDNIEVGGLLLCKAPADIVGQRNAYYAKQTYQQQQAVDNNLMKESDSRMPLFKESKSKVSFGSGS